MAFIDDSDLAKPEPKVVFQQAPRGPLVPILLIVLIICVIAVGAIIALPHLKTAGEDTPEDQPVATVDDLDPKLLVTPTGRKLDVVQFGGYLFEITRITYSNHAPSRTVTITVPGDPPAMGIFHIGESFAGGKIRIAEITGSAVVLEHEGQQKIFPIIGANPSEIWDKEPSVSPGTHMIPPRDTGSIPDIPDGAKRAPKHPIPEAVEEPEDKPTFESLEDFPYYYYKSMPRADYEELRRELPDRLEREVVFAVAIEPETRRPYGLEVKNMLPDSFFYAHGLKVGDVVLFLNGESVTRISELDHVARRTGLFSEEIMIEVERTTRVLNTETKEPEDLTEVVAFVFYPGASD